MTYGRGPNVSGEDRRASLLQALERLLTDRRLDAITIADISREARVTRSNFYFYFPSKGAAVAELLEPVLAQIVALATNWDVAPRSTPAERVRRVVTQTVSYWQQQAPLMLAMAEAAATDAAARAVRDGWIEDWARRAAACVVSDGHPGPPSDEIALRLTWMLVVMTVHAMERDVRELVDRGNGVPDLAQALATVWTRAIYGS